MTERPSLEDVELATTRLLLRPWRATDAGAVFSAMQDRRMHEFLCLPNPYTKADAAAFVTGIGNGGRAAGTGLGCAVVERATDRLVGSADLRFSTTNLQGADIGYAIYPWGQGNGFAAEASGALADWGHAAGINRIEIRCAVTNLASIATARAAGFTFEGTHRAQLKIPAGEIDAACFARLASDEHGPKAAAFPPLGQMDDGVVRLRVISAGDADAVWEQDADPIAVEFGLGAHAPTREAVAAATARAGLEWQVGTLASMAIIDMASSEFAGSIRLRMAGPPRVARMGYAMRPSFRGRGYVSRAARLVVRWAFEVADLARIELGAKFDNLASQRAALSAGFEPDGIRAGRLRNVDGSFSDEARFAVLNPQTERRISP